MFLHSQGQNATGPVDLASPTQWLHIGFGREGEISVNALIDLYVVVGLVISILSFLFPSLTIGFVSTYFSAVTLIAVLNIVLLQRVFGAIASPERSLLLFICNVVQIVFMFATWYLLYDEKDPLLTSVLTFATISHSVDTPRIAMAQIATNFLLLAVYLSHIVGRSEDEARANPFHRMIAAKDGSFVEPGGS